MVHKQTIISHFFRWDAIIPPLKYGPVFTLHDLMRISLLRRAITQASIDMTEVVEILHDEANDLPCLHSHYHGCWWPGDARSQGISNHDIDQVKPGQLAPRTLTVKPIIRRQYKRCLGILWRMNHILHNRTTKYPINRCLGQVIAKLGNIDPITGDNDLDQIQINLLS